MKPWRWEDGDLCDVQKGYLLSACLMAISLINLNVIGGTSRNGLFHNDPVMSGLWKEDQTSLKSDVFH